MEYTLHLTPKGRQVYLSQGYKNPFSGFPTFSIPKLSLWERFTSSFFLFGLFHRAKEILSSIVSTILSNPLLALSLVWANYRILRWVISGAYHFLSRWLLPRTARAPRRPRPPFWSSFFGGGGDDPRGDDPRGPPPPYARHPNPSSRKTYQVPPENQGWNPGFWTGLAGGAAAGYGLGSRRSGTETAQQQRVPTQPSTANAPRTSGWFGGSSMTDSSSRDDRHSSGSTHTSTGFGGTRRR